MRRKLLLMTFLTLLFTAIGTSVLNAQGTNVAKVAKVGNTEYATIDEAIANWTNNTTLTLLADVTLSDVVTIKSTEHHILNLGTYTMTAASGKNAFVIQACGNGSAERSTITINADANNPGGINAGSKCIIYYKYADGGISTEDRPIIKINGGVFSASTATFGTAGIYTIGSAARKCATLNISGGTFNCTILGNTKSKLIVSGGVFNYPVSSQGDSTALRLISGGTFKSFGFMTADDNNTKFWIGTSMGNSNVGTYIDDEGYLVVGGPVVTEAGEKYEASTANYSGWDSDLKYSSAKDNGLYYTSVEEAFADNNTTSGSVTVYVDELDMTGINYKGTIVVPEGEKITIVTAAGVTPTWTVSANNDAVTYTDAEGNELVKDENGSFVVPPVAKIGETSYETLQAAVDAVQNGQTITLLADAAEDVTIPAGVTFNGNGKAVGNITAAGTITFNGHTKATSFNVENTNTTINIVEGACLDITGSGRMVIGHGCTFNITGTIADAKTANVADVTPSLVMPGASFTGAGVIFNVTNAYLSAPSSYCSSSSSASGTFDFNITNSIWESAGKLAFEAQSTAATVNFELKDSKLTTGSHLVFGVSRGEVVIDNSNVNVGSSRQIENQSTMTIKNGAVVNGAVATSSNAKNPGTIIVENATYAVTGEFSGSDLGTGTLIVKKGATVSAGSITKANIQIDATGMTTDDEINLTANLANLAGTLEVINNDNLDAEIIDGKIVLVKKTVAMIGDVKYSSLQEAFTAATSGCTIEILSNVTIDEAWDNRYTGTKFTVPVTINGNDNKLTFKGTVSDGGNYHSVFRFQADATVKNLTIDLANATADNNRVRAISSSANLVVEECSFIGNNNVNNARAIIFGEGAGANVGNLEISITNSVFINWKRGITDNENAQDVKTVTITGNTLTSSAVYVSAKETVTFTDNTVSGAYVNIRSYSDENNLSVTATGNTLEENTENNYNYIYAKNIEAQEEFVTKNPPLKVSTKDELSAAINAANDGDVIEMTADIDYGTDQLAIAKAITLDLGGKTLTTRNAYGGMSIKNNPTIKNGNIVHASNTAAIKVWNATAFEDLVIDVQGKGDANKTIGGIVLQSGSTTRVGSIKNVTIIGDALTNGIETYNCGDAEGDVIGSMENVNIDAVGTAMLISAPCGTATNCTFDGGVNGIEIWIKGNYSASLGLVDCDVVGGVFAHDEFSSNPEIVNNGTLNLTADEATTGAGVDDVTLTLARVEAENVDGVLEDVMVHAKAKVNNTYYQTLAKAVEAAQDGEEIDLLKDVELTSTLLLTKNNILDGNGFMLTPAEGFTPDGNGAVIVLAANMSGYEANRTYTVKNLTIEGFSTPSRIVRANFCDATIQNCLFNNNTSASIITSAYAVLNVEDNIFTDNTATGYAVIDVGSDVSDGTNLVAKIIDNTFENNQAATAGIYLTSSADVKDNHFKGNTHTGDNANAAAILAGPYTGNMAYTVNINSNAFENAMSKDGTALPSVFAEDWSADYGSTTSFDLSLNYWDGNEPVAGTAYKTSGDNPQVTVKSYYRTYTDGTLGGLVEYPQGNQPIGYVSETTIWGETWSNARTSYVIEVKDAEGNVMGTSTLNPELYTFNGNAAPTWHITLPGITDEDQYWIQEWTTVPSINNMPAKVALFVDGVEVNEGPVKFNTPDDIHKIYAATADAEGNLIRFYNSIETIVNNEANVNVVLVRDVTGSFETFHNVTLYSGVKGGASITNTYSADYTNFNKVIVKNGVTLNMNSVYSTTAESVNTIEGTMNVDKVYYHSDDAKTEIKNGGKVTTGGMTIVRYNYNPGSGIYIYGDGDDATIEFSCQGDAIGAYSGTFYAEDAVVETKGLRLDYKKDNSEESDVYAQINAKFVDTKLSVSSELRLYKDAALTLNGATVTAGKVQIRENATPTINIDNSTIKANSVENLPGATWNAVMDENGYVTFVRTGLAGEGTEANPYLINNLEDLVYFRDQVNTYTSDKSNQFKGKFVKLTNDIDLQGINWTPIGTNSIGDHAAFLGTFYGEKADGTIPTISNLYINADGDHLGFFARVGNYGDESCTPTIKNIKFNNVDVSSNTTTGHGGSYVAGVIANAGGNSVISNIEVTGDVYVVGYGYIGGIVGHGYPDIDNCHVIANEGSYIQSHYWCCGGIIGYAGEGGTPITNSSVSGVDIWARSGGAAAVAGVLQDGNRIENVSASNVNITSDSDYCMGYIAGNGEASTLTEISIENVTATVKGNPITATDAVAQIGNSIYFNLQDVLNAGGNVTVLRDIALAEGLTVAADKTVVLDLNGKTITGTPAEAKEYVLIANLGNLTITDNTEDKEGKIVCDHKLAGSTGYAVNTITNSGTLKIAAGTIQNTSTASNQIGYAIDNNSTTGNAILVIEGGEVTASGSGYYDGIRQFCNSETNENSVTIIDGEVSSLWLQNPSDGSGTQNTKDVKGSFAINDGTLNNLYLEPSTQFAGAIIGGHVGNISRFQTAEGRDLEGFISGGTFSSDVSEFCAKGFVCNDNGDGTYGVVEKSAVAKIDDVEYKYIQDAIDAANATDVINVVSSTTENITIAENDNITLTFSEGVTLNGYFAPFRGNLTINGGTINNTNSGASAIEINAGVLNLNNVNIASARHAVRIDGAVTATINGGEYTLTATSGTRHAVNVSGGAEVTIKAGTFVGPKGTTMDSGSAVCVQSGSTVTIEGGDFSGDKNHTLIADGNLIVTGGTFDQDPSAYLAQGYITKYNETTSRYEVFKGVAKIENEYFASIQDAIDAAQNNDVITVISDFEMDITSGVTNSSGYYVLANVANKAVVIDLNGKKVTVDVTNLPEGCKDNMLMSVFCADTDGNLTLKDSSNGNGSVSVTGGESKTVYSLVIAYGGLVNIEGGNYSVDYMPEGRGMIYGNVSDHSGADGSNVSKGANISGGNFTLGNVGTLANGSPWILATAGSNTGKYIFVTGGTYNADILHQHWIFEVVAPTNKALKNNGNGTYTIVDAVAFVKHHEYSGYYSEIGYATLAEAFEIAETGDVVTLVTNVELENTITVNAGKDVILDLNGKVVSASITEKLTKSFAAITNKGTLTVRDSGTEGKITVSYSSETFGYGVGLYTISNEGGVLNIESGIIENTTTVSGSMYDAIDNNSTLGETVLNISGGEVRCAQYIGIRQFANNTTNDNIVNVTGGKVYGGNTSIWMQNPNSNQNKATIAISGNAYIEGRLLAGESEGFVFAVTGGTFDTDVTDFCAEGYGAIANATETLWTVMPAQEQYLGAGYNWYSSYLNINTDNLLEALGESGISVAGNDWIAIYSSGWDYDDHTLDFSKMYMIETNQEHTLKLTGELLNAGEIDIDIEQGWNWIGYPSNERVEINTALTNHNATDGDRIVTQGGFVEYVSMYGGWIGSGDFTHFEPTKGYQYFSANNDAVEFNYNIVPAQTRGNNETAVATHYSVDYTKYPFNMTMVAVVDGAMNDNYEVAALVNGEVRGSARPVYVEALDTYMLFLTISGDEVEEVSFKYYDITTEEEYELVNRIEYSNNAMVGSANEPYVLSRGTTGIGGAAMSNVNIYPNPTTTGTEINLQATCDKVEIYNALGVKVIEYHNVDAIDALETAGIYVIRITNNGNVQNCRLVVK